MSSHASRVWITSGRSELVGQARPARRTPRAGSAGASGRSGSRARTRRSPPATGVRARLGEDAAQPVEPVDGVVGVDAGRGPHAVVTAGQGQARGPSSAASVPTVTIPTTPAAPGVRRSPPRASSSPSRGGSGCRPRWHRGHGTAAVGTTGSDIEQRRRRSARATKSPDLRRGVLGVEGDRPSLHQGQDTPTHPSRAAGRPAPRPGATAPAAPRSRRGRAVEHARAGELRARRAPTPGRDEPQELGAAPHEAAHRHRAGASG